MIRVTLAGLAPGVHLGRVMTGDRGRMGPAAARVCTLSLLVCTPVHGLAGERAAEHAGPSATERPPAARPRVPAARSARPRAERPDRGWPHGSKAELVTATGLLAALPLGGLWLPLCVMAPSERPRLTTEVVLSSVALTVVPILLSLPVPPLSALSVWTVGVPLGCLTVGTVGNVVFGLVGGAVGSSVFPTGGTVIGALLGGAVGRVVGSACGAALGAVLCLGLVSATGMLPSLVFRQVIGPQLVIRAWQRARPAGADHEVDLALPPPPAVVPMEDGG